MRKNGLHKIASSEALTRGEKKYILDYLFHTGGSFTQALFAAIACADRGNLGMLETIFPSEVAAFLAWTQGDLQERASKIAGGDASYLMEDDPPGKVVP